MWGKYIFSLLQFGLVGCPHYFLENVLTCQVAGLKTHFGSKVNLANGRDIDVIHMTDLLECIFRRRFFVSEEINEVQYQEGVLCCAVRSG